MDIISANKCPTPRQVFLSYGHDRFTPFVNKLKEDLVKRGHEVWFDADRIKPGLDWERYIENGLAWVSGKDKTGLFILLMTPHSVRRPDGFCLNELARAIQLNLKIIPVMIDLCEPPLSICRIQWLDMRDCTSNSDTLYTEKFNFLLEAIEQDRMNFESFHDLLLNTLKPLSFDAEVKYSLERFIGREWVFKEIEQWIVDPNAQRIFWITGSPGVGKTSIAAWLCTHWREVSAFHFCRRDNMQKIDPRRCVLSIAYQLSTQLPEYEERLKRIKIGDIEDLNASSLFDLLIVQLLSANFLRPDRTVIILIDALDEATINGKNELAGFIASEFERTPEWLRLIITSRPDQEVMGLLQAYTPFPIDIGDWRNDKDIYDFFVHELKDSVEPQAIKIIAEKCNGLFIYANWILKELKYKRLSLEYIDEFPRGLGGIYVKFFERQFPDIGIWESGIRPALEVMAASQEPIQIKTLSAIFKWNAHDERTFRRSLGSLFTIENGAIQPFHKSVMEWLTNEDKHDRYFVSISEGHRTLASYILNEYKNGAWTNPMVKYLPIHLFIAGRCDDLKSILEDINFLRFEWDNDKFNIMKLWALIEGRSRLRMVTVYKAVIDSPQSYDEKVLVVISSMLLNMFHFDEAKAILNYLVEYYRRIGEMKNLQKATADIAHILQNRCDYTNAMTLLKDQERICRDIDDRENLQRSLLEQANILWLMNKFDDAMALLKEQELICRELGIMDHLQESLNYQSLIQRVKGNLNDAMALLKEQELICRKTGNLNGLQHSLLDQGLILRALGDLDRAFEILKDLEVLAKKIGHKEYIQASLGARGTILRWRGDVEGALSLCLNEARLCRDYGDTYGLLESQSDQAIIMRMKGDLDGALSLLKEIQQKSIEIDSKFVLQLTLGQEAIILRLKGELDTALSLHREEERICREIGHKRDMAMSLSNQGIIQRLKGNLDSAMALHNEAEMILRKIGYLYGLQECLGEKAMTLYLKGDLDTALVLFREQEKYCKNMGLKLDLIRCLENLRTVLHGIEDRKIKEKCITTLNRDSNST